LFGASGGTPPYHWAISSGALPGGLSLTSGGQLGGTPSASGHPSLTIRATDAAGRAATAPGTFTVYSALAVTQPCASLCSVEQGCTVCGGFGGASGGLGPYHYTITSDNRPDGMGVSGLTLTGSFPPPGPLGQFDLTVQVSDHFGAKRTVKANWYDFSHISLADGTCLGNFNTGCTVQLPISGGTPNGTPSVKLVSVGINTNKGCWTQSDTAPPKGYSLTVSGGVVTVSIPPRIINGYGAVWTLVVTDQSLCGPGTSHCASPAAKLTIGVACG
jgi:hypothetical protein